MLAGLIIATHDAADRPGTLTATLPFGGVTLIEYQARLLIGAGASQLVVLVARLTPELLGALGRIARRGVAVDTVRSAAEAAERLHPLARVVMLADGLTTTPDTVAAMAREGGDALLVVSEEARGGFERVGSGMAWAGIARLDPRRIAELAALPRDYDMESTLVRLASQAQAAHVPLTDAATRGGHGIDHRGAALAERGRLVIAAAVSTGRTWFDRLVIAPIARGIVPLLVPRHVPAAGIAGAIALVALGGIAAIWSGHAGLGMMAALVATILAAVAAMFVRLRDDVRIAHGLSLTTIGLPALAVLLDGRAAAIVATNGVPAVVALTLVVAGALGERAIGRGARHFWWGTPPAYLAIATIGTIAGAPTVGLALAALGATATLAAAIEGLRRDA